MLKLLGKYLDPRRARFWGVWALPVLVLGALLAIDPDGGLSTAIWLASFSRAFLIVACAHLLRKLFFDYPDADMETLFGRARSTPEGAGLALVALAIFLAAVMLLFSSTARAQDVHSFIPANARALLPVVQSEKTRFWPDHPFPALIPALIEHESCVTLVAARCWNAASRLKTSREEGAGLGQITRAYRVDGSVRFDALSEMVARHPALDGLSWSSVYSRPDLQIRSLILMGHDNYTFFIRFVPEPMARLAFADAAYNGGKGDVQRERQVCQLARACDPKQWFGNVALHCVKSTAALYGQRSPCAINRHHVEDVLLVRPHKYVGLIV